MNKESTGTLPAEAEISRELAQLVIRYLYTAEFNEPGFASHGKVRGERQ
jgi:hypothetical protein